MNPTINAILYIRETRTVLIQAKLTHYDAVYAKEEQQRID